MITAVTLTPRECEVLVLRAQGLRPKEIAGLLGIAPATVQRHFQWIYEKLGVHDPIQAFHALGWLRAPGSVELRRLRGWRP